MEVGLPFRPEVSRQHDDFHGGVTATIADNAGGYAAYSLMPAGADVLTVEFKISLLAPARGERLVARGRVKRPGRTLTSPRSTYGRSPTAWRPCAPPCCRR